MYSYDLYNNALGNLDWKDCHSVHCNRGRSSALKSSHVFYYTFAGLVIDPFGGVLLLNSPYLLSVQDLR